MRSEILLGILKEIDLMEDLDVNGKEIVKLILQKDDVIWADINILEDKHM
jgi:hypothetical protein